MPQFQKLELNKGTNDSPNQSRFMSRSRMLSPGPVAVVDRRPQHALRLRPPAVPQWSPSVLLPCSAAPASVRPCPPQTPAARVLPAGRLRVVRALQPPALCSCVPATPAARSSAAGLPQCRRPPPPKPSRRLASSREGNGQAVRGGVSGGGLGLGVLGGGPFLRGPPGPASRI